MSALSLQDMAPGFADSTAQSQVVFRCALDALARPGTSVGIPAASLVSPSSGICASASSVLLALLDQDCTLWLSPTLANGPAAAWLRFHTGCQIEADYSQAGFVWAASIAELPPLHQLKQGSAEYPDQSATCVVDVTAWRAAAAAEAEAGAVSLRGPGVRGVITVAVDGMDASFVQQHHAMQAHAPCGVDMVFCAGDAVLGFPRSVRLQLTGDVGSQACT
jgi:alpha-D-ribose 1-methylphosphonate 5-triphosphate synthase subunit PhnH